MNKSSPEKTDERWTKEKVGEVLKSFRAKTSMTQRDLGDLVGKSQQGVGHWESGKSYPSLDVFFELCKHFQINMNEVFLGREPNQPTLTPDMIEFFRCFERASADDKDTVRHILGKYKKNIMEEFSSEIAI